MSNNAPKAYLTVGLCELTARRNDSTGKTKGQANSHTRLDTDQLAEQQTGSQT